MLFYSDVTENEFIKKVEDEVLEEGFIVRINHQVRYVQRYHPLV